MVDSIQFKTAGVVQLSGTSVITPPYFSAGADPKGGVYVH
jgi:hypothetical protein